MTTTRVRSACLTAAAALSVLALAPVASAAPGSTSASASGPSRLAACNEVGSRQPGDALMQVRLVGGGKFEASYPGYVITKVEGLTLLGGPMCITVTAGGPGTDHVSGTTTQLVGNVKVYAKPAQA
ncbi:hypothetical protein ACFCX4_03185 [Kitasatospora sp. NPDC056327]|uniref:hypothetical protein n=1 Tax=Kitasatospora sp. NPDC056327 TaxID=3345785 RepID=UPI0035DEEFFD